MSVTEIIYNGLCNNTPIITPPPSNPIHKYRLSFTTSKSLMLGSLAYNEEVKWRVRIGLLWTVYDVPPNHKSGMINERLKYQVKKSQTKQKPSSHYVSPCQNAMFLTRTYKKLFLSRKVLRVREPIMRLNPQTNHKPPYHYLIRATIS